MENSNNYKANIIANSSLLQKANVKINFNISNNFYDSVFMNETDKNKRNIIVNQIISN